MKTGHSVLAEWQMGSDLCGHHSLFSVHALFPQVSWHSFMGFFSASRMSNSHNPLMAVIVFSNRVLVRVLVNLPPFTCLLVTTNTGTNH